jgi:hypothetical protein
MLAELIRNWVDSVQLDVEQSIMAALALKLAEEFDDKPHTSTAAELRKTLLELQRQLKGSVVEVDPLADLLRR